MTNIIRNSALALALLGGVALASAPALADQRHGHDRGNSWNDSHNDWHRNNRSHGYYDNGYAYRAPYSGYGNYSNYGRPGFSIYIR